MVRASVKPSFVHIYGAKILEGRMQTPVCQEHGSWSCRIYVEGVEGATARLMTVRLGHLDALVRAFDGVDLLAEARREGWDGRLVTNRGQVVLWSARHRAERVMSAIARTIGSKSFKAPNKDPQDRDWTALENNLGEAPTKEDRKRFADEFAAVVEGRSSPKTWGES